MYMIPESKTTGRSVHIMRSVICILEEETKITFFLSGGNHSIYTVKITCTDINVLVEHLIHQDSYSYRGNVHCLPMGAPTDTVASMSKV